MVKGAEQRLTALERRRPGGELGAVIVIYDATTGQPLQPVPPGARVRVWIPDNGRDKAKAADNLIKPDMMLKNADKC